VRDERGERQSLDLGAITAGADDFEIAASEVAVSKTRPACASIWAPTSSNRGKRSHGKSDGW